MPDKSGDTNPGDSAVRVLYVDDDPQFASMTESFLDREDRINVVTELDPRNVLDRIRSGRSIDCIVSDYQMPSMNGLELLAAVRRLDESIPFILFTSAWERQLADKARNAEATDTLPKGGIERHATLIDRILESVLGVPA